jgi:hypothetical protein
MTVEESEFCGRDFATPKSPIFNLIKNKKIKIEIKIKIKKEKKKKK